MSKRNATFAIVFTTLCISLMPSQIRAFNLGTMGSFDVRQVNAQKITLLSPGSTALDVSGHTLFSGNLDVTGILNVNTLNVVSLDLTSLNVTGNTLMSGNLDVSGTFTAGSLDVSSLELTSLDVSGNTLMSGDLDVTGILSAALFSVSSLDVSGNSLMSGNLDVTGILTAGTLNVTALSLNELEITDNTPDPFRFPLNVSGNTRLYQPNSVNGKALSVTGDTYMQGLVDIDGTLSASQLDVTRISTGTALEINTDLVVNGNMDATGTTHLTSLNTMQNALDVSGNSLISGDLEVTGTLSTANLTVSELDVNKIRDSQVCCGQCAGDLQDSRY